jgi:acyl carrier protein
LKIGELEKIMRMIFKDQSLCITEYSKMEDIENWDSLSHLNLVLELESVTGKSLTFEQIESFTKIENILKVLAG